MLIECQYRSLSQPFTFLYIKTVFIELLFHSACMNFTLITIKVMGTGSWICFKLIANLTTQGTLPYSFRTVFAASKGPTQRCPTVKNHTQRNGAPLFFQHGTQLSRDGFIILTHLLFKQCLDFSCYFGGAAWARSSGNATSFPILFQQLGNPYSARACDDVIFLSRREEEECATSYSGSGESRISSVYYKWHIWSSCS